MFTASSILENLRQVEQRPGLSPEVFDEYVAEERFVVCGSDSRFRPLVPGGEQIQVCAIGAHSATSHASRSHGIIAANSNELSFNIASTNLSSSARFGVMSPDVS